MVDLKSPVNLKGLLMPGVLACDCVGLSTCMVECSIDKYIFFNPGRPYELHVPYEILN